MDLPQPFILEVFFISSTPEFSSGIPKAFNQAATAQPALQ